MPALDYECKVTSVVWLASTVVSIRFEPSRQFKYEPGQFLSIILPNRDAHGKNLRRIYSFASAGKKDGYELCVQVVPHGKGSNYLASLKVGDVFRAAAPYGDFFLETPSHRNACFIATGTGIAPFKAFVLSERFKYEPPQATLLLFGARNESDILFPGLFEQKGAEVVHALSRPSESWNGFRGRVTDFLKSLPDDWAWRETDFYLCGNGFMVSEVYEYLTQARRLSPHAIRQEAYFSSHHEAAPLKQAA
jgi:NAD(P)H-flavin reductase